MKPESTIKNILLLLTLFGVQSCVSSSKMADVESSLRAKEVVIQNQQTNLEQLKLDNATIASKLIELEMDTIRLRQNMRALQREFDKVAQSGTASLRDTKHQIDEYKASIVRKDREIAEIKSAMQNAESVLTEAEYFLTNSFKKYYYTNVVTIQRERGGVATRFKSEFDEGKNTLSSQLVSGVNDLAYFLKQHSELEVIFENLNANPYDNGAENSSNGEQIAALLIKNGVSPTRIKFLVGYSAAALKGEAAQKEREKLAALETDLIAAQNAALEAKQRADELEEERKRANDSTTLGFRDSLNLILNPQAVTGGSGASSLVTKPEESEKATTEEVATYVPTEEAKKSGITTFRLTLNYSKVFDILDTL